MKKLFFITMFLITLISCNKKKNIQPSVYEFEVNKQQQILLDTADRYNIYGYKIADIDGDNVLVLNVENKKLSFYNLKTGKKINEILLESERTLENFKYINKDSIFIFYEPVNYLNYETELKQNLVLIDYSGNIKKTLAFKIDTIALKKQNIKMKSLYYSIFWPYNGIYNEIITHNNKIFYLPYWGGDTIGTNIFMKNRQPFYSIYDINTEEISISNEPEFPYVKEGIYYPRGFDPCSGCLSSNGSLIIRYFYSSDLFECNIKNNKITKHNLRTKLLDTIRPADIPVYYAVNNLEARYSCILYDPYREIYFSELYFDSDFYGLQSDGRLVGTMIIADKDFNYLGEVYCNNYYPYFYVKDNMLDIYVHDSVIDIIYLTLKKTNKNYDQYIDSAKNTLNNRKIKKANEKQKFESEGEFIINFLKSKTKVFESDYTVVTVTNEGCIGCVDEVLSEISANKKVLNYRELYLILAGPHLRYLKPYLEKYDLKEFKVIIDTLGIIKSNTHHQTMLNPRLTIVRDNKSVYDSIYDSSDMKNFLFDMYGSVGIHIQR